MYSWLLKSWESLGTITDKLGLSTFKVAWGIIVSYWHWGAKAESFECQKFASIGNGANMCFRFSSFRALNAVEVKWLVGKGKHTVEIYSMIFSCEYQSSVNCCNWHCRMPVWCPDRVSNTMARFSLVLLRVPNLFHVKLM
jgi:hypothetical protein